MDERKVQKLYKFEEWTRTGRHVTFTEKTFHGATLYSSIEFQWSEEYKCIYLQTISHNILKHDKQNLEKSRVSSFLTHDWVHDVFFNLIILLTISWRDESRLKNTSRTQSIILRRQNTDFRDNRLVIVFHMQYATQDERDSKTVLKKIR